VPRQGSARDAVEIVVGETAVTRRIDVSLRSARTECRVLDRPPYREVVTAVPDVERDLLSRGVRVRTVYDQSAVEAVGLHHLREAGTLGERSRLVGRLRIRLFLVDDRLALLPLKAGVHPHDGMLLVHPSALLDALSEMFELVWERAVPLELESGADTDGGAGDADESALLGLLAAGLTDGAIARQLGLSIRTVERRISKIMTRLQARTRFQAGIMLGQNRKST
jgi:DNA-binding CsgD family transcriptional regulator